MSLTQTEAGALPQLAAELPNGFSLMQLGHAITHQSQELIILPTEKCNFRCTYCYEDFAIGRMSESTQRALELFLDRRVPTIKKLVFSWFGGEPLVAKDVVLRLAEYANALCQRYGVEFQGGMTTNAYLLNAALMRRLLACRQGFFQITLDGWAEAHDALRQKGDGSGTFQKIWKNLLDMRNFNENFEVVMRIHVRRDNIENLHILLTEISKEFGGDRRFRIDFQHLRNLGGSGGKTVDRPLTIAQLREVEIVLRRHYNEQMNRFHHSGPIASMEAAQIDASILKSESAGSRRSNDSGVAEPYICYAARPNSMLIRANGRIGKCTVAFSDSRNDIGYLREDGTIDISNEKLKPWMRGLETLDPAVTGCPLNGMPKSTLPSPQPAKKVIKILSARNELHA